MSARDFRRMLIMYRAQLCSVHRDEAWSFAVRWAEQDSKNDNSTSA